MSIPEAKQKIKYFLGSSKGLLFLHILVLLGVGFMSFLFGYFMKNSIDNEGDMVPPVKIILPENLMYKSVQSANIAPKTKSISSVALKDAQFMASKRGKNYYPISCSSGSSIKESNRVYFNSKESAENKGYKLSLQC